MSQGVDETADKEMSTERLGETERLTLEVARMNRKVALANAEKALAQNDSAELSYRYIMLQMYMKYGLSVETDTIDEQGYVHRKKN